MCSIPALRALRSAFPEASVTLIGLPWAHTFIERFSCYIDHLIEFPGFPGLPEQKIQIEKIPAFLNTMQENKFDLALQMHGSGGISNPLVMLFNAQMNAGFCLPGQYVPDPDRFLAYPLDEPEILRHLRLMEFLGIPSQGTALEFPLHADDWEKFHNLQNEIDLKSCDYAVLHPGSRSPVRRWPAEWFAAVGDGLVERGLSVVVTGTAEEREIAQAVVSKMSSPAVNLAGRTDLGSLGALLSASRLLVSNDTGVSHIAAALELPSVVLFTASDPERWAPLNRDLHRVVAWATAAIPQVVLDEIDILLHHENIPADTLLTRSVEQNA